MREVDLESLLESIREGGFYPDLGMWGLEEDGPSVDGPTEDRDWEVRDELPTDGFNRRRVRRECPAIRHPGGGRAVGP